MTRDTLLSTLRRASVVPVACVFLLAGLVLSGCGGGEDGPQVSITAQPASTSVVNGASATFSVGASGYGLAYQWQLSVDAGGTWADIAGATAASYTIASVDIAMSGREYRAVIIGPAGTITSSAVTLAVAAAGVDAAIAAQPADQSVVAGADASFAVTATGTSLNYQWQSSAGGSIWTDVIGATAPTLTLSAVALADSGRGFRVVVSNATGSVTSNAVVLMVHAASAVPIITAQPSAVSVVAPNPATFTVGASGAPAPTFQWQQSIDAGLTYTDISGAAGSSFTTPATSSGDSGKLYRVHVINPVGDVFSSSVALTVDTTAVPPVIGTQPISQAVTAPGTATFSVSATGTPTPTFQWQLSNDAGATYVNVNGATASAYTTPSTTTADSGKRYRVVVSNSRGSTISSAATLTVNAPVGPGGSGGSAQCSPWALPSGTTVKTVFANSTNPALAGTATMANNGVVTFDGHAATEVAVVTRSGILNLDAKLYADFDAASGVATLYGSVSAYTSTLGANTTRQDTTSILTPPIVDNEFTLAPGQSVASQTEVSSDATTTTVNGVAGPTTTSTRRTSSLATTFVGIETVTVAAGTFSTCRYQDHAGVTKWLLLGYGTTVKDSQGGAATAITVNGVPLTCN